MRECLYQANGMYVAVLVARGGQLARRRCGGDHVWSPARQGARCAARYAWAVLGAGPTPAAGRIS